MSVLCKADSTSAAFCRDVAASSLPPTIRHWPSTARTTGNGLGGAATRREGKGWRGRSSGGARPKPAPAPCRAPAATHTGQRAHSWPQSVLPAAVSQSSLLLGIGHARASTTRGAADPVSEVAPRTAPDETDHQRPSLARRLAQPRALKLHKLALLIRVPLRLAPEGEVKVLHTARVERDQQVRAVVPVSNILGWGGVGGRR